MTEEQLVTVDPLPKWDRAGPPASAEERAAGLAQRDAAIEASHAEAAVRADRVAADVAANRTEAARQSVMRAAAAAEERARRGR